MALRVVPNFEDQALSDIETPLLLANLRRQRVMLLNDDLPHEARKIAVQRMETELMRRGVSQ